VISPDELLPLLPPFLAGQRWFAGTAPPRRVELIDATTLSDEWPALMHLVVDADGDLYQVFVGLRLVGSNLDFPQWRDDALLGNIQTEAGTAVAYDASMDPDLGLVILRVVTDGREVAERSRPIAGEQSNTSLVYDDRLIVKLFRRLFDGPNPEVEITTALARTGFTHVTPPVSTWRLTYGGRGTFDLAVVQPYLVSGTDGWALALTSLRDLFGAGDTGSVPAVDGVHPPVSLARPGQAGGDFSAEARRLGELTSELHVAMASAFGSTPGRARAWADEMSELLGASSHPGLDAHRRGAEAVIRQLRGVAEPGPSIRVHGDYHLAQVMRTDAGWYVLDFEGEPGRPVSERGRTSSPMRDVAGMLRSIHYASMVVGLERHEDGLEQSRAWERHNRAAFLDAYLPAASAAGLVPGNKESLDVILGAFEMEKAIYEVGYEVAHRPDWVGIPMSAVARLSTPIGPQGPSQ